jgi:type IV pilus assembly protein PilM
MALSLRLRKPSAAGSVGLDIDGRFLAAVEATDGRIQRAASVELPEGVMRDGEVVDAPGLAAALKSFAADANLPRNVRLGVANQQIVVRLVELPQIEDAGEREAAVRFQAAEAIAMPLDEAVLDHQLAGYVEDGDNAPRMQVVLVAARRSMIEALLEATKSAGLKAEGIDLDAFALVRVLAVPPPAEDSGVAPPPEESARVFCHLAGVTNLAVAVGSSCLFTRPLSTTWDEAGAAARLTDEVRMSIDFYMGQPKARPVGEVVLSGPGSRDEAFASALRDRLGLETTVAQPLGALDTEALGPEEDPHRYTVAAGLALGAAA